MHHVAVLNVVGLNRALLEHAPRLRAFAESSGGASGGGVTTLEPVLPAVTCSVQASMTTGLLPEEHGIVGNGWYDRETAEVRFWRRSDRLVRGEKVWEAARRRDASFTCANLFWWHNTYSACDVVVQARPIYKADGRKIPDCYSNLPGVRDRLQGELGRFPLFRFWGPMADITSTRWIARAAQLIDGWHAPTLSLVYLPHLDYCLQKLGPGHADIPRYVGEVDAVAGGLLDYYAERGVRPIVLSEYGVEPTPVPGGGGDPADGAIYINRVLREAGLLAVREEDGREVLDPGASGAFAVADHQVAHVYHDAAVALPPMPHCERIELGHERAGDTVLLADHGHWFTYDYWPAEAPEKAPDFARTVDIHRKPGYDPRELFSSAGAGAIAWKLLRKKLGFRQLMDVVPLDTALVRGTHGRADLPPELQPVLIGCGERAEALHCTAIKGVILDAVFGG